MKPHSIIYTVSAFIAAISASGNTCYLKGGQQTSSTDSFRPCFPSDPQTHCCDVGQTCLSNGLCFVKWDTSVNTGACTDSTFSDSACFQSCDEFATLYRCSNNQWCCSAGGNTTSCCNDPNVRSFALDGPALIQNGTGFIDGYSLAPSSDIVTTSGTQSASSPTATSSSAVASGSNSADTSTTDSVSGSDGNTGALAAGLGAGLGVGIPLAVAVGVLTYLLMRERKKTKALQQNLHGAPAVGAPTTPAPAYQDPGMYSKQDMAYGRTPMTSQSSAIPRTELPGHGSHSQAQELQ